MSDNQTYAVIKTGGKQRLVQVGKTIKVEKIDGEVGSKIKIEEVLMISSDGSVSIGAPTVAGSSVEAEIQAHGRNKKVTVVKFKRRKKYRRKQGHRQDFTELKITNIKAA